MHDRDGSNMQQVTAIDRIKMVAAGAGIGAGGIGGVYLAAWLSGTMTYRGIGAITVKANSALCLLLYGVTLTVVAFGPERNLVSYATRMLAVAALTIGALTWLEHLFGWDFGIDQFIAPEAPGSLGTGHPNRMGPPGAMTYTVVGIALLLLLRRREHSVRVAQSLGLFVCLVAFTGMLGYLYGATSLYGAARFTIVAWPAAIGNFLLGTGLLFLRPREGLMAPITALDPGGAALRRLLPAAVAIPIFLGWLHLQGESLGLYERYFGSSILVLALVIIFSFLVYRVGAWISRSAAAIRESEEKFGAVFRQAAVGMARVGFTDARWIDVNDAFCRMLGHSSEEMLAIPWPEMTHPDDVDLDQVPFRRMAAGELETYSVEKRFLHKSGRHVAARLSLSLVRDAAGRPDYEIAVIEDITERKRAEESLRLSEEKFAKAFATNPAAIALTRLHDGLVIEVNDTWLNMFGYRRDEVIGKLSAVHVWPTREARGEMIRELLEQGSVRDREQTLLPRSGAPLTTLGSATTITVAGEQLMLSTWLDITRRKRAEQDLKRTVEELERSNRELQQFAYVSSHDLQEPLRMVTSYAQLLQKRYGGRLDEKADGYIAYIVEAAERMSALIRDLLEYSLVTRKEERSGPVSMEAVLNRAVENLSTKIRESGAALNHDPLPNVTGNGSQLVRLFQNLLENCLKYRNSEIPLQIRVSAARQGNEWVFGVHDNGIGLSPQFYDKIFRIFQRLHQREEYAGTGMGLAICRKIVERHSGRMWVESKQGEGSSFYFTLPATKGESDAF